MILVGLTGGIASGKSLVSKLLKELGAYIIDADEIAREVIQPGEPAYQEILPQFGDEILNEDGTIDRSKLGRLVFSDPVKRTLLEGIVHPRVFAIEEARRRQIAQQDPEAVIIFDAPLLIETRAYELMDKVIVVYANPRTQLKRLMERDHLEYDEAKRRIAAQLPIADKRQHADYIINSGDPPEEVAKQTEAIYQELKALAKQLS
ncbi:MAG TPA: dephospho-CoA kinase [Nitrospiria bacterium]|nr:dephospho-CoA kinase [Nitrospiria bacterium]